jgi:hypothetical protein
MKFEFLPDFKSLKFKPENYRKMMKRIFRILSWILGLVVLALIAMRLVAR